VHGNIIYWYIRLSSFFFDFSLLKGRPVYIGLAVDLNDYELNIDPSSIKPLNLKSPRNPKDEHEAAIEAVLDAAKKAKNIVVIVDA
jgi:TPP-dependent 2-oxoacid decarboxylase